MATIGVCGCGCGCNALLNPHLPASISAEVPKVVDCYVAVNNDNSVRYTKSSAQGDD